MKLSLSARPLTDAKADLLAIGVPPPGAEGRQAFELLDTAMTGRLTRLARDEGFEGKPAQVLKVPVDGAVAARWIALVGLGADAPAARAARTVAARGAQLAAGYRTVAVVPPTDDAESVRAAAAGLLHGAYRFDRYLTADRKARTAPAKGMVRFLGRPPRYRLRCGKVKPSGARSVSHETW